MLRDRLFTLDIGGIVGNQKVLLLDGGVGSEIQRRGVTMDPSAWSAAAHWYHPDLAYQIHCDYIRAGAQVITTNSFYSARHILETIGLGDLTEQINRHAVELALKARHDVGRDDVFIAGSMSTIPSLIDPDDVSRGRQVIENHTQQASALAQAGVDILLCEMLMDSAASRDLIACASSTGLPVWAGVSASVDKNIPGKLMAFRTPGKYRAMQDESFDHLVEQVSSTNIEAMGIVHTKPAAMTQALKILRKHWSGHAMAYAETGHFSDQQWRFEDSISPQEYAQLMVKWIGEFDLQVVGGCCGTTVEHIKLLSQVLRL